MELEAPTLIQTSSSKDVTGGTLIDPTDENGLLLPEFEDVPCVVYINEPDRRATGKDGTKEGLATAVNAYFAHLIVGDGSTCIAVFADRDIYPEEEILLDYGKHYNRSHYQQQPSSEATAGGAQLTDPQYHDYEFEVQQQQRKRRQRRRRPQQQRKQQHPKPVAVPDSSQPRSTRNSGGIGVGTAFACVGVDDDDDEDIDIYAETEDDDTDEEDGVNDEGEDANETSFAFGSLLSSSSSSCLSSPTTIFPASLPTLATLLPPSQTLALSSSAVGTAAGAPCANCASYYPQSYVEDWTVSDVIAWATYKNFKVDAAKLKEESVDGMLLLLVDMEMLTAGDLGSMESNAQCVNLLLEIAALPRRGHYDSTAIVAAPCSPTTAATDADM